MMYHAHSFSENKHCPLMGDGDWRGKEEVSPSEIQASGENDERCGGNQRSHADLWS